MGTSTDTTGATRYVIVHGLTVVTDEAGRLLLFCTERSASVFSRALKPYTLDLVVVIARTPDQIDDIVRMNGLGGEPAAELMVEFDEHAEPETIDRRAAEVGELLTLGSAPTCADKFGALERRLRGE